jgi:hypothetical protein
VASESARLSPGPATVMPVVAARPGTQTRLPIGRDGVRPPGVPESGPSTRLRRSDRVSAGSGARWLARPGARRRATEAAGRPATCLAAVAAVTE